MGKITHSNTVIDEIQKKIAHAPHNWASVVAAKMGKSETTIYAYANGTRGLRRGYPVEVLKHLNEIIAKQEVEIEKILNNGN